MRSILYCYETYKRILDLEERRGNLRKDTFSGEIQKLSLELGELRRKVKCVRKEERDAFKEMVNTKRQEYEKRREEEIRSIAERIRERGAKLITLSKVNAKGKTGYTADNVETLLLSKVLMLELKRSYKQTPANRNAIIEELRALLDNPMPKTIIRADIHHFFESIPQEWLIEKILEDSYLTPFSLKCLKTFFYRYNELRTAPEEEASGIPRGLCFSSYLAEIYMAGFDRRISQLEGVYFYKRYVDDIILIACPTKQAKETYWQQLEKEVSTLGLTLNDDEGKSFCSELTPAAVAPLTINYLGYQFRYQGGHLDVLLTEHKFNRYKTCVRLAFEKYKEIGHHSSRHQQPQIKKQDATLQFMHRLSAITGNGHLNGRKNYVQVGIYYSNKYLTTQEQLEQLDEFIRECLHNKSLFSPVSTMFQYGHEGDHQRCITAIKEKILSDYSFVSGFVTRRMYRWSDYVTILRQLGNLYYSQAEDE